MRRYALVLLLMTAWISSPAGAKVVCEWQVTQIPFTTETDIIMLPQRTQVCREVPDAPSTSGLATVTKEFCARFISIFKDEGCPPELQPQCEQMVIQCLALLSKKP